MSSLILKGNLVNNYKGSPFVESQKLGLYAIDDIKIPRKADALRGIERVTPHWRGNESSRVNLRQV